MHRHSQLFDVANATENYLPDSDCLELQKKSFNRFSLFGLYSLLLLPLVNKLQMAHSCEILISQDEETCFGLWNWSILIGQKWSLLSCFSLAKHNWYSETKPNHVMSCDVKSRHVTSWHAMSRHVMSCHVMSRHITELAHSSVSALAGLGKKVTQSKHNFQCSTHVWCDIETFPCQW